MFHQDSKLGVAAWYTYLSIRKQYTATSALKYPTIDKFTESYEDVVEGSDTREIDKLWQTANWMSVMFAEISARGNKGFVLQVSLISLILISRNINSD